MAKTYLCDFIEHLPPETIQQKESIQWLADCHAGFQNKLWKGEAEKARKFVQRFSVQPSSISKRMSYVPGIGACRFDTGFFQDSNINPDLSERSGVAGKAFDLIFSDFYGEAEPAPEHLFHVSCTHYESPSAAQKIVAARRWPTITTHLYHMGCYASLPAIRTAKSYVADGAKRVDIVHTEICSLHLNPTKFHPEQVIVQSLFADGAIRYSCVDEKEFIGSNRNALEILSAHEIILEETFSEMTWKTGSHRFEMTLSKNAPKLLAQRVESFCVSLFEKAGLDFHRDKDRCDFAVHPGGPKIIESVQESLSLKDEQVSRSKDVLFNRGNMSSATLPHIWKKSLEEQPFPYIATMGFGPGLTLTGALFKLCCG